MIDTGVGFMGDGVHAPLTHSSYDCQQCRVEVGQQTGRRARIVSREVGTGPGGDVWQGEKSQ